MKSTKHSQLRPLSFTLFFCLLLGCGNYNYDKPIAKNKLNEKGMVETKIDFQMVLENVLKPKCMNCHDRHSTYESYPVVKASAESILDRIISKNDNRIMPPLQYPQLTQQELEILEEWILAGAPESIEESPVATEELIFFEEVKQKVLKPYHCIECHSQYEDYAPVRKAAGAIASLVASNKMPFPQKRLDRKSVV